MMPAWRLDPATGADAEAATACSAAAFAADPLMHFFFSSSPVGAASSPRMGPKANSSERPGTS